jgi:DNA invertase Pin-like site-specific DNA recombinase
VKYIGYMRVSRDREGGISADQQRNEIEHWAATPGKEREIIWLPPDTDWSGKSLERPSIQKALKLLRAGQVDGLVVSKLDRLTRSVADLNGLIKEAQAEGWNLVGLDIGVDLQGSQVQDRGQIDRFWTGLPGEKTEIITPSELSWGARWGGIGVIRV